MKPAIYTNFVRLLWFYVSHKYEGKPVVVVCLSTPATEEWFRTQTLFERVAPDFEEIDGVIAPYIIVPCDTLNEAVELCNAIPDSMPYAYVLHEGEAVHENT